MTRYRFTLDEDRTVYPAEGFDPSWNGWASPIVTRETLCALIAGEDPDGQHLTLSFAGATATLYIRRPDATHQFAPTVLKPDPAGLYHLAPLGWTFHVLDNTNTPSGHPGPATGFTATWTMDFEDAATPQDAARSARAAQTAHGSLATVFTITDNATGQKYLIDLLTDDQPDTYPVASPAADDGGR